MADDVNAWVKRSTRGMIGKIFEKSDSQMLMCLLNALAFEGKWADNYEEEDIEEDFFHNIDGTRKKVLMLYSNEDHYIENERFTGFLKPYKGIGYSFMALLPKEKKEEAFRESLSCLNLADLYENANAETVRVELPEFKSRSAYDLTGLCKNLGIKEVFALSTRWLPRTLPCVSL